MRFRKYLNEKIGDWSQILEDCKPFLEQLKKDRFKQFLYSGRKSSDEIIKKPIRKDRRPKDTPEWIHEMMDKEFDDKFGVKARSASMFAFTGSTVEAKFYGNPYYVFPIGRNYMFLYSEEIGDLYDELSAKGESKFGKHSLKLLDDFEKSETLVWNENLDRYAVPKEKRVGGPTGDPVVDLVSGEREDKELTLTKDEYIQGIRSIISDAVSTYKKTKSISDIPLSREVMIICKEVWMVKYDEDTTEPEMKSWINDNI